MNLQKLLPRLRLLVLALPLFALSSTIQAGCSSSSNSGYYGNGNNTNPPGSYYGGGNPYTYGD